MAKEIKDISLFDLLPSSISDDEQVRNAVTAIDPLLKKSAYDAKNFLINSRIDELPEPVLDLLAWQWHVDFYEPLGLSLERKRKLVKESLGWHRIKGTPEAVRLLSQAVYPGVEVDEWYSYGGRPYYFRLTVNLSRDDGIVDEISITRLLKAVSISKNVRSWLDYLTFNLPPVEGTAHVGGVHGSYDTIPIPEEADIIEFEDAVLRVGGANGLIVRLNIPQKADEFDFLDALNIGGKAGSVTRLMVPEKADDFEIVKALNVGGKDSGFVIRMPVPEEKDVINFICKALTSGRMSLKATLSVPEKADDLTMTAGYNTGGKYSVNSTIPVVEKEV